MDEQKSNIKKPRRKRGKKPPGISGVLFTHTKGKLLALFYNNIDRRYYLRDISQEVGISIGSVNGALKELVYAGIIDMTIEGKKKFYSANRYCPVYEELKNLVLKTVGIVEPIKEALEPLRDKISAAFIFGSVATGEDTGRSDIDLFVVGRLSLKELSVAIYPLDDRLKRPINPHLYSPERYSEAFKANDHFIKSILKTKLIYLIGTENDLGRLDRE